MREDQKKPFNFVLFMLTIFVGSSLLFLEGFFRVSNNQKGKTGKQFHNIQANMLLDDYRLQPPLSKYDQIVLMVIDAWRADYPNGTNMPFAYDHACDHLTIKVDIPTVTMPRIKSLTTGATSSFIDIVLNLGHTTRLDESILHRLSEKNKKTVFAGDRTWIQLFPNNIYRAVVNTDSFYVNDFYEGDLNVTRALKEELKHSDWHLMVLHYLGLDHIGHVEGSHSDKIYLKLLEMDYVIEYIEANICSRCLLLLTGDHGMRNGGSHGGSDVEELFVPLMTFQNNCIKKKRSYLEYNQIDIAATLAVILDVKIPQTSIGCLIPELLESFSQKEQLYLFYYNTFHLMEKLKEQFNSLEIQNEDFLTWYKDARASHKEFISNEAPSYLLFEKAKQNYLRVSKKISQMLSESLVQYNMPQILLALLLATLCAIKLLMNVLIEIVPLSADSNQFLWKKFLVCLAPAGCVYSLAYWLDTFNTNSLVTTITFTCSLALIIYFAFDVLKIVFAIVIPPLINNRKVKLRLSLPSVLLSLFLCHTFSLASSSFIEEEHQTWYYFTPSLLLLLTMQNFFINVKYVWQNHKPFNVLLNELCNIRFIFIVMLSLTGCRRLNQTGDKWRHIIDIGDILTRSENHFYLTLTLLTGLTLLFVMLMKYNSPLELTFCTTALSCVFFYRQVKDCSFLVLILFCTSLLCTQLRYCRNVFCKRKNFGYGTKENLVELLGTNLTCCVLISALLHRPHNVILLPILLYTLEKSYFLCDNLHLKEKQLYSRSYVLVLKTVITIFIANTFYFFQGNSNSLATIDLNPGYIGLSSYNPYVAGLLITINTYCAPINAFLYLMWHMFYTQRTTLPLREEKEQITNVQLLESTKEDLYLVYTLFTASTLVPVAVYWCLLVGFRHHLFIYSVFAPKAFYECFQLLVFYINFIVTILYFRLFL